MQLLPVTTIALNTASGLVVYVDARRRGYVYGGEAPNGSQLGAAGWGLGALLVPILFVPAYVVRLLRDRRSGRRVGASSPSVTSP